MTTFFETHNEFTDWAEELETVRGRRAKRLNYRFDVIIKQNAHLFPGCKVLDIASYDGRWPFAALKHGATHVTCVEKKDEPIEKLKERFRHYQISEDKYTILQGDAIEVLENLNDTFDITMCLGYFYHIVDHSLLLKHIRRVTKKFLLLDTSVKKGSEALVYLEKEFTFKILNAYGIDEKQIVGVPTIKAVELLLEKNNFEHLQCPLHHMDDIVGCEDYLDDRRKVFLAKPRGSQI